MRELKFRAWNGEYFYIPIIDKGLVFRTWRDFADYIDSKDDVQQYTGLKDKNGKEIYEGDIVKCTEVTDTEIEEYISEVFWEDCCFLVHQSEMCDCYLGMFEEHEGKYPLTEIEIIGNIYENRNLLKE